VICTSHQDTENAAAASLAARPDVVTAATRASRRRPADPGRPVPGRWPWRTSSSAHWVVAEQAALAPDRRHRTRDRHIPHPLRPCGMHPHPGHPTAPTLGFTVDFEVDPPPGGRLLTDGDHSVSDRLNNMLAASRCEPIRSAMARGSFTVTVSRQHESRQTHGPPNVLRHKTRFHAGPGKSPLDSPGRPLMFSYPGRRYIVP